MDRAESCILGGLKEMYSSSQILLLGGSGTSKKIYANNIYVVPSKIICLKEGMMKNRGNLYWGYSLQI